MARVRHIREYESFRAMHRRCDPASGRSKHWGDRGITVCDRWRTFENFLADMGPRPEGMTLDRIDNNGNYEPSNCRWATWRQQHRNRRNNRSLTAHGETMLVCEWAELLGVRASLLMQRIYKFGWSEEDAVTIPFRRRGPYKPRAPKAAVGVAA